MLRSLPMLAVPLLAAAVAGAQPAGPLLIVEEAVHDAGNVDYGDEIVHDFVLLNEGTADLEILEVQPTCGCSVAEYDEVIPPGARGRIHTVVSSTDLRGPIAKSVIVRTNDPATPELNLVIKANVRHRIVVTPGYARFLGVEGRSPEASVQFLWATTFDDLEVTGVRPPYPYVEMTYREATESEERAEGRGRQWRIEMRLSPDAPVGALAEHAVVHVNHPQQDMVRIPVAGFVRPLLAVSPPAAEFGRREITEPYHARLEVESFAEAPIHLTRATTSVPGVETLIEPVEEGRHYQVRITLTPGMPKGEFQGTVRVETTSPEQPELLIEISGTVL